MKEKKNEELYSACTSSVLRMGNLPTSMVGDFQRDPSGTSRQLVVAKAQHLMFDVAENFTQRSPETTYSDGKHESRLVMSSPTQLR